MTLRSIHNQPLAIIGIGCRFPGNANTPQTFWEMLCAGKDGIIEVPKDRWSIKRFYDENPAKAGKVYVKEGGFLRQPLDEMDALFFGISPREAETLDPQQRLLLEVAWEALEDAGLIASQLAGSNTGVFMGGFMMDHLTSQTNIYNRRSINTHSAVSYSQTLLSARLAYMLDLRGPCFTMDTACSSSLVAIHQASQALWRGECELALVGGVNVMYKPETPMTMAKGQFLAADGRSKSFDARGDGYGRGEGAGIVVLKPLAQAQEDGDLIYATIVATGINQDGRTDGITVPNPKAQAELITSVLKQAEVSTDKIVYIEAHGTGTNIGDPTECQALGEALHKPTKNPCWIGSLKANIGHLEAAVGIAGLIKTALCLTHQQIPPVANLQTPNPAIPFEELGLRLPRSVEALPQHENCVYAGVNSFGYGGTNAHALLQQFLPSVVKPKKSTSKLYFLPLSARSEKALPALARRYAHFIAEDNHDLGDICYSAATRREHHRYRLALIADSSAALQQQLNVFAEGQGQHLLSAKSSADLTKPIFVMTGMGPQWWATGQELLQQAREKSINEAALLKPFPIEILTAEMLTQALQLCKVQSVVVRIGASSTISAQPRKKDTLHFKAGSYLITGGFGGFGLKLAEWLVKQGVRHLVLVGRSGAASDEAKQTLALLHEAGVQVMEARVDIADGSQVAGLIAKIQQELPSLAGIFHTAAVLDDAMLIDLTAERLTAVMHPKALGAWHLHHYTKTLGLDYFVLFSSISALVGKPGQGNYVAANAYLDHLACYRKAKGLAGLSLNWGVLAEVGMAARQGVEDRLMQMGINSFTADEAMQMLAVTLNAPDAQLGLMNIDWKAFWNSNSNRVITLRYEHMLDSEWLAVESPLKKFYNELKSRDSQDRLTYIIGYLINWIASIMRLPVNTLATDVPLNNFGLDSLMAVEIQGLIERQTGVSLSVLQIMQDNSIEQLADTLLARLESQLSAGVI